MLTTDSAFLPRETTLASAHLATPPTRSDAPRPRVLLWQALLLGVAGDALLFEPSAGVGFAAWIAIVILAAVALVWGAERSVPREAAAWMGSALLFASLAAWRESGALQLFDFFAVIASLGMAGVSLRDDRLGLWAPRLRDTLWAGGAIVVGVMRGILPLAFRELFAGDRDPGLAGRARVIGRAALLSVALLAVFGSLLGSADPIFAKLFAWPEVDLSTVMPHVLVTGFFAWTVGGWAYGALVADPAGRRAPDRLPMTLGALDVTTALGTLNVLFAAFVVAQLGWFFGGEAFLRETTGLTAAAYARQGFFQMVWVVALVVPVLLGTRAALEPGAALERRHTMLALPILGLLAAIIVSALLRMRLYVQYFGMTTDRLYALVAMAWLAAVLALLAGTVLRGRGRPFVAGSVVSGLAVLATLHLFVPDVLVARMNIARADRAPRGSNVVLDLPHLAELSGDAAALATEATIRAARIDAWPVPRDTLPDQRCEAAETLLRRWGPSSWNAERGERDGAWRWWNAGTHDAMRVVHARAAELRAVQRATCVSTSRAERSGV